MRSVMNCGEPGRAGQHWRIPGDLEPGTQAGDDKGLRSMVGRWVQGPAGGETARA